MANWQYKMKFRDLFSDAEDLTEDETIALANNMARRIREFCVISSNDMLNEELEQIASDMAICSDVEDIDYMLDTMYDICDLYRVWVE